MNNKRTKIVCTIGPATKDVELLKNMMLAGMNVARINFSHGGYEDQEVFVNAVKKAREEVNLPVALLLDTKGPEIRTGKVENGEIELKSGEKIILTNKEIVGTPSKIFVNYIGLYKVVKKGTEILINDGKLCLSVDKVEDEDVYCTIVTGGPLTNQKSVNIPDVDIDLPALSDKDIQDLKDGCKNDFDYISASFIRSAEHVREIRKVLDENGGKDIKIISKIENRQGVNNIEEIIKESDGIMVARGDLGVEIPFEEVPVIQKRLIKLCNKAGKIVITATQMLESMTENPRPTRAEVSDVANAIYDGTTAIMLSGESAAGKYPLECVKAMSRIAVMVEADISYWKRFTNREYDSKNVNYEFNINHSICLTAKDMNAKAFVAYTEGGDTPSMIASFLPGCPIFAITSNERTYKQMVLRWAVTPILIKDKNADPKELISMGIEKLKKDGLLLPGDIIAIAGGNLIVENSKNVINRTIGGVLKI